MITLSWGGSCLASDTNFEVYEGTIGSFYSHTMVDCNTGLPPLTLLPSPGNTYYVIVPRSGSREGSYGTDSSGTTERPQGVPACLPREIAACP